MADGEVTYEIRGDLSNLDRDLNEAERRIRRSSQDTTSDTERDRRSETETARRENDRRVEDTRDANDEIRRDSEETSDEIENNAEKSSGKISSIAKRAGLAIGSAFVAVGAAVVGVGTKAVSSANDMDKAMNQYISSTGKGVEETDRYQHVLENIYANNYGESFEDIADKMSLVTQQMGELSDEELQSVIEAGYTLQDTFDIDVSEGIRSASTLMKQFGLTGEEAYNLIAQGEQQGLDFSDELIDSINEYSVHFAQLGLSAEDMFNVFLDGSANGAFNLDKIGDAVKELGIRVKDGSANEAFEELGLNADELVTKFNQGGDSAKEAFYGIFEALSKVEDQTKLNTLGTALMGTMWEDLGKEAATALGEMSDGFNKTVDTVDEISKVKYDDLGSMFDGLKRAIELLLIPLGEQLIPLLQEVIKTLMPYIEEFLPPLIDLIGGTVSALAPMLEEFLPTLLDLFGSLIESLMPVIEEILPLIIELFTTLLPPIMDIVEKALPPLVELISALSPIIVALAEALVPVIECFLELLDPIINLISSALVPLVEALTPIINILLSLLVPALQIVLSMFMEVFAGIVQVVTDKIKRITSILNNIIDFVKNIFAGNWKGAWENIKNIFSNIVGGFVDIFKRPINVIIDCINGFLKGINKIKIPDWVPGVGGKGFNISLIPRLKRGANFIPNDYFPAFLDYGERVLTREQNAIFNSLGGVEGMSIALSGSQTATIGQGITTEDIERLCRALEKVKTYVTIDIDGKETMKALAPHQAELDKYNEGRW